MKTQILLAALLGYATAFPSLGLLPRQEESDDEGIIRDEAYLEAAVATSEPQTNGTLPEDGPVALFIPPGRISQDCSKGVETSYIQSVFEADWMQTHPGRHTAPKNKCRRVHRGGDTCFWLCAKGKRRHVHNHRIGAIAADINVGCHSGSSLQVRGKDIFPQYNIWVTNTCT